MILNRAQRAVNSETTLVEGMIDALSGSGLPWLRDNQEHMDVEPGVNDLDASELEWLESLSRNSKSVLATTISTRFVEMKAWENQEYLRQLQIVVRILSVLQEFRRLHDVLQVAISNNSREDTLALLITTVATWHPALEGMGVLPSILNAIALNVYSAINISDVVENNFWTGKAKRSHCHPPNPSTPSSRIFNAIPRPTHRRI